MIVNFLLFGSITIYLHQFANTRKSRIPLYVKKAQQNFPPKNLWDTTMQEGGGREESRLEQLVCICGLFEVVSAARDKVGAGTSGDWRTCLDKQRTFWYALSNLLCLVEKYW